MSSGDDLGELLAAALPDDVSASDVLAVAHKVVSKSEGRVRELDDIDPTERAATLAREQDKDPRIVQAVLDESAEILRAERGVIVSVTHQGLICANAGVDASNAPAGQLVLLPADPDGSARRLRRRIAELCGVRPAVVITDSFGRPWRTGQTDVAVGAAGLEPVDDWRGREDAHGRTLRGTAIAIADAVAAAADLARSKDSREPAVLVRGLERFVGDEDGPGAAALRRERQQDLFR